MMILPVETHTPFDELALREFNFQEPPPKPAPVFSLGEHVICTAGNLTNIQALPKVGKSAVIGAMLAAVMNSNPAADTLGFTAHNPKGHALIHLDTEQSRYDHYRLVSQAMQRAGVTEPPPWFHSFYLADLPIDEREVFFRKVLDRHAEKHGGVFAVMIDGIADLCGSLNDEQEAFDLVARLQAAAIKHESPIVTVLHENPGSSTGKTRGHLGSQIERKAETNLRLAKDGKGITTIWAERARHCHLPKEKGHRIQWSDERAMHVAVSGASEAASASRRESALREIELAFAGEASLRYGELVKRIEEVLDLKERAAKDRVKDWKESGFVRQRIDKAYERNL